MIFCMCVCILGVLVVSDSVTPCTVACQAPLSLGLSWQEYLEWVAISSSRGSSQTRDRTHLLWLLLW